MAQTVTEELLKRHKEEWLAGKGPRQFAPGQDFIPPSKGIAIIACMDARVSPYDIFGLKTGEAHVIRNAGGFVTDDVLRCLTISQELLLTKEIIVVHHSDCGMSKFHGSDLTNALHKETGQRPHVFFEDFGLQSPAVNVRENVHRILNSPFIRHKTHISGFVYDDAHGTLIPVKTDDIPVAVKTLDPAVAPLAARGLVPLYKPKDNGEPGGAVLDLSKEPITNLSHVKK
eukprot:TRINITY_DN11925_c0_g1_i1.p1 TRINITY_DN11925_c0_g1~~TRINITY_DN11925_c0_g1_i1.p1  ORF type:complete len:249 (-),score=72.46 TRINITY_DN11925_c0_g1_i1:67-753(-)